MKLLYEYNNLMPDEFDKKKYLEEKMFLHIGKNTEIVAPLNANLGCKNVSVGDGRFINFNLSLVDDGKIFIGNNVLLGPNVTITTVNHPKNLNLRLGHYIEICDTYIGDNVWIGANVIILPGVTIGKNSIIGAGSVVTKDIPENVIAYGNPCKVIKKVD